MRRIFLTVSLAVCSCVANAADLTILVAPRDSAAAEQAAALADGKTTLAERKIHRAFDAASAHLSGCGSCTVTVKIAGGEYIGKARTGQWIFPDTKAPQASLHILGGYNADFSDRAPFERPAKLVTPRPRSGVVLRFEGKKHAFKELVISGFAIDVGPSNNYDGDTNSLLKGTSSSWGLIALGYVSIERLVIADNIFMNAAHSVGGPAVRPMSANSEVIIRNNFFLNNVYNWTVTSANKRLGRYLIENNSFVMNWPYNPDTGTANPSALNIGNRYTANLVEIRGNLFAYNPGGAIQPQWDDKNGPPLAIIDNVFFANGTMFQQSQDREGMIVGKFNGSAQHNLYDPLDVEDDFSWQSSGNRVEDPEIAVPVLPLTALGEQAVQQAEPAVEAATGDTDTAELELDFESELNLDDFELDTDFDIEELADDGVIKNYAPMMPFNRESLPFSGLAGVSKDAIFR